MAPATAESPALEPRPTPRTRVVDTCRQAAHLSHEVRLLKSVARDTMEEGAHAARRAVKSIGRHLERVQDMKDEAVYRVKRQPLRAVGAVFGVGIVVGFAAGWAARRSARRT